MERLSSLDAGFLHIESDRMVAYLGAAVILDPSTAPGGTIDLDVLTSMIADRLHLLPPFRRRLVEVPLGLGTPYWVQDDAFDLDYHLRESAIPAPGTPEQLATMVGRTFSRPFDRSRPLWELWLVHGIEGGKVALLTKFHHALVDGVSGNEMLGVMLDPTPEGRELPPDDGSWRPERRPSDVELVAMGVGGLVHDVLRALRTAPRALPLLPTLPGVSAVPGVPTLTRAWNALFDDEPADSAMLEVATARAPRTLFNGPLSAHRCWAYGSLPLDRLKKIKNAAGVTINDVVVALCAGAIREWLDERGQLPEQPLVAAVPISVRDAGSSDDGSGNQIGMMTAPIATHVADPLARLARVSAALSSAKERHGAVPADVLTDAASVVPPAVASLAARTAIGVLSRSRPPVNALISNVPGPREPLYCAGARMEGYFPVPPIMDGVGLNVTVVSYLDQMCVGIVTDREQIPEPHTVFDLLPAALDELESAVDAAQ